MTPWQRDALVIAGLLCLVGAAAWWHPRAGLMALGVMFIVLAFWSGYVGGTDDGTG